ncbi:MAG: TolC family protein [Legionella sp.]|nr:TolC family protein [Legionella sp.]
MLIVGIFSGLSSGCRFQPSRQVVEYPVKTRNGTLYLTNATKDFRCMAWWRRFQDPVLNHLITQALACNNDLKRAEYLILQAQAQLLSARALWLPTFDGSLNGFTGGTWDTHLKPEGPLANTPLFPGGRNFRFRGYDAGFLPGYSINILNNLSQTDYANANLEIQLARAQSTRLSIISQMSGAYWTLLSQRAQLHWEKALVQDLKKLRHLENIRFQRGASDLDRVTRLNQDLASEVAKIPHLQAAAEKTENAMQVLLNQNPAAIKTNADLMRVNPSRLIPTYLPAEVLKNRPDMMIAFSSIKSASAELGIAYSAFFPTINMTTLVGSSSFALSHLLKVTAGLWIARISGATKLFNLSAYANIKSAKAFEQASYYDYMQTLRAALADVDSSLTNAQQSKKAYEDTYQGYLAAKRSYQLVHSRFKAGAKDYRDVVNAKINIDRYQLTLIQEKAQWLDSLVQVYTSVGGGYLAD